VAEDRSKKWEFIVFEVNSVSPELNRLSGLEKIIVEREKNKKCWGTIS
jgi:hypothetical protein